LVYGSILVESQPEADPPLAEKMVQYHQKRRVASNQNQNKKIPTFHRRVSCVDYAL